MSDDAQVQVTRRFDASAEQVYDAWLDPERTRKFLFATPTGQMVRAQIDARVGGKFLFVDRRDGQDVHHFGEYLELDRPRRIVFTFAVTCFETEFTTVSLDIVPQGAGCEVTLTQDKVLKDYAERTRAGWGRILDGLAKAVL